MARSTTKHCEHASASAYQGASSRTHSPDSYHACMHFKQNSREMTLKGVHACSDPAAAVMKKKKRKKGRRRRRRKKKKACLEAGNKALNA